MQGSSETGVAGEGEMVEERRHNGGGANATTRKECNCTNDQKFSYAVAFSDCREKVR